MAPTIVLSGNDNLDEGSTYTLNLGPITDPGDDTVTAWIVHWGDGLTQTFASGGDKTHTYVDGPNSYTIQVDLTDEDATHTSAGTKNLTVDNVVPTIVLSGNNNVDEGSTYTLTLGSITDPGDDTVTDWIVHWGDGVTETFTGGGPKTHTYADGANAYTIRADLTDEDATHTDAGSKAVTVLNVAPTIVLSGNDNVDENSTYTLNLGTITDPGVDTITAWIVHWGDGVTETFATGGDQTHVYADGPNLYTIRVDLTDEDDTHADAGTKDLTVDDVAPTIVLTGNNNVDEGSTYSLDLGPITDPGDDTVTAWIVHWGDGLTDAFTSGGKQSHVYADGPNFYTIQVDLTDEDGTHTGAGTKNVTVDNVAPTIVLSGNGNVDEGSTYTLTLDTITDPGVDTVTEWIVHWGDGLTDTFTSGGDQSHVYADGPNLYTIWVDLKDEDGTYVDAGTKDVTVDNVPPTIVLSGNDNVDEGSIYTLDLDTITDPGVDTVTAWIVHWGDGSAPETFTSGGDQTHVYADGPNLYTIRVDLTDEDGTYADAGSKDVTVDDVDPTIVLTGNNNVDEGSTYTLTLGTITDPGVDTVTEWIVHWGDGVTETFTSDGNKTHTYADGPNLYTIRTDLTDEDGTHADAGTKDVTVDNMAPVVAADADPVTVNEAQQATNTGTFSDVGDDVVTITTSLGLVTQVGTQNGTWSWWFNTHDGPDESQDVIVRATDSDGAVTITTFRLEVDNVAPVAVADVALVTVDESRTATNTGTFSDVGVDAVTITASIGTIGQVGTQSGTWSWSFDTTDGPAESQTVTITATDSDGDSTATSFALAVDNLPPDVAANATLITVEEGKTATNTGTFSDLGDDVVTITASIGTIVRAGTQNGSWTWSFDTTDGPDQSQIVQITADDGDGGIDTATFTLTVLNLAPTVTVDNTATVVNEGQTATNAGSFADLGNDVVTVTASIGTVTQAGSQSGTWDWWFQTTDGDDENQTVTVTASDSDGAFSTTTFRLFVNNVAPTNVQAGPDQAADEADLVSFSGAFTDPGDDTHTITWSFGDGASASGTLTPTHTFADDGVYTVMLTVEDDDGGVTTDTLTVTVNNVAPTAEAGPDQTTALEGQTLSFSGTFIDPGFPADTHTFTWDFGDGQTASGTLTPTHVYADDGLYTVTLTVEDDDLGVGSDTLEVTVTNVAPVVAADNAAVSANEGQPAANTGTFSDAGTDVVSMTASIGTVTQVGTQSGTWSWTFGTTDGPDDSQTITIRATDSDGDWTETTFDLTVDNVAPVVTLVQLDRAVVERGVPVTVTGSFTDAGILDRHTVSVNWGDTTTSQAVVDQLNRTFTATHAYTEALDYAVGVTVLDNDGAGDGGGAPLTVAEPLGSAVGVGALEALNPSARDLWYTIETPIQTLLTVEAIVTDPPRTATVTLYDTDLNWLAASSNVLGIQRIDYPAAAGDKFFAKLSGTSTDVDLRVTVENLPPQVAADNPSVAVDEGQTATNTGTFSDPNFGDVTTMTASIGTVTQSGTQDGTWSWSMDTTDGPDQSQDVFIRATDSDGYWTQTTFDLTVDNAAPNAAADNPSVTVDEGQTATNTGTFSDPGIDDVTISASIGTVTQVGTQEGTWSWSLDTTDGPDQSQVVTITATDSDNAVTTTTFDLAVDNVAPSVVGPDVVIAIVIDEGQPQSVSGTFSDPGIDVVTISASMGTVTQVGTQSGTWNWSLDTTDGPDSGQTVTIRATDDDGDWTEKTFDLFAVSNVAPSVAADNPSVTVDEGQTATNAGTFSDPGIDVVTITASIGTLTQAGAQNGTWTWSFDTTEGLDESQTVTIRATDDDGDWTETTFDLTVRGGEPAVAADNPSVAVDEGQTAANTGTFSDRDVNVVTIAASIGTLTQVGTQNGTWSWSLDTADGPDQSQTVTIRATDDDGDWTETTFDLAVGNLAPTVAADNPSVTVDEGQTATNTGTFSDQGFDLVTITASIGTVTQVGTQAGTWNWSLGTTDGLDESQTVTIRATDDDGDWTETTLDLTVLNVAPSVAADNSSVAVDEGQTATNAGTFSDPGIDVVAITTSVGTVTQVGTQAGTWTWSFDTTDGLDESQIVTVRATDSDGDWTETTFDLTLRGGEPVVAADNPSVMVDEGQTATNTGTFSDPDGDVVTITASVGTAIQMGTQNGTWSWSLDTTDGPDQSQTVTIRATDQGGDWAETTFELAVGNLAPSVAADNAVVAVDGGQMASNTGTFSDLGVDDVTITASTGNLTQAGTQSGTWSWSRGWVIFTGLLDQSETVTITATDEDGDSSQTTFVVANLIQHVGSTITVGGTDGDDLFEFDASVDGAITITINGLQYTVDATEATDIIFDGGPGDDAVILTGSDADDVARFYPERGTFEAAGSYLVTFSDVSSITAHGAGADAAYMYDSPGADTFTASPFSAEFTGPGFAYETHGFMYNYGYATTADGGRDTAVLNDSAADDKFKLDRPQPGQFFGKMYRGDYFNRAKMFEVIVANSSGGDDLARFFDSPGDDTFEAQKGFGRMQGPDFDVTANNYSQMIAFASTGNDVANLTDSAGDDTIRARGHKTEMYDTATKGGDYKITVRRFDDLFVAASTPNGGHDVAKLHDTALDDLFVAAPGEATLSKKLPDGSLDLLYQVMAFERVKAYGLEGGNDTAVLNDTTGDDHLEADYRFVADLNQDDTWAGLYTFEGIDLRLLYDVIAFDQVEARSSTGRNTTDVAAEVDFLLLDDGWEQ